jgi:predicted phage tail protein
VQIGQKLVDVHLHGPLGERFGEKHRFAVNNPVEAISALDANYPGFVAAFNAHGHYFIHADGDWRDGDDAAFMPVSKELHFVPRIEGRAFMGAALVGALFPAIAGTAAATIIGGVLMTGLLLGISFLLTPKAKKPKETPKDENYGFSGPENVTTQGAPVPLIYGRVHAGSVVISAGLEMDVEYTTALGGPGLRLADAARRVSSEDAPAAGWPPLMQGPYGLQPKGWDFAARQLLASPQEGVREAVIFIAPNNPPGKVYAWSEISGFYSFNAGLTLEAEDYQREGRP